MMLTRDENKKRHTTGMKKEAKTQKEKNPVLNKKNGGARNGQKLR